MNKSDNINELIKALCEARKNFKPIVRDKTVTVKTRSGGDYKFTYAPLENVIEATTTALADAGLAVMQFPSKDGLESILAHSSGQYISNTIPIVQIEGGPQAFGSAISYARRYALGALLNIAFTDDDDANIAEGNKAKRAPNPGKGSHTPTDGAVANLSSDLAIAAKDDADAIVLAFAESRQKDALDAYLTLLEGDPEYMIAVWEYLKPESAIRSSLKRMKAERDHGSGMLAP